MIPRGEKQTSGLWSRADNVGAMLDKMRADLSGDKELKVKIATRLHVQLHHMKIVHGQRIQDTVAEALEMYFRDHVKPQQEARHSATAAGSTSTVTVVTG